MWTIFFSSSESCNCKTNQLLEEFVYFVKEKNSYIYIYIYIYNVLDLLLHWTAKDSGILTCKATQKD